MFQSPISGSIGLTSTRFVIRLIVLVGLVVGAVSPSTAMALKERYFVEGAELPAPETVQGTVSTAVINATWNANTTIQIECKTNMLEKAKIETVGLSEEEIKLTKCELLETTGGVQTNLSAVCTIAEPIQLKIGGALTGSFGAKDLKSITGPKATKLVGEVTIKEVAGKVCKYKNGAGEHYNLEGSEYGSFGANGAIEQKEHEVSFPSCPHMQFNKEPAELTLTVTQIKLTGARMGQNWSMQ